MTVTTGLLARLFAKSSRDRDVVVAVSQPGEHYAYRASLVGAAHRFELTDDGLCWRAGRRSGLWRYDEIAAIRLSYRPVSMQARRFRADLENRNGARIDILSTSWQTATLMAPQEGYRAFILQLHRRLAETGGEVALRGGLRPRVYHAAIVLIVLAALAMAALLVRAVVTGEFAGVVFILGFAALFGWQIGGFVRRNRPRHYTWDSVPMALLPS